MPVWATLDPLPIIGVGNDKKKREDEEEEARQSENDNLADNPESLFAD